MNVKMLESSFARRIKYLTMFLILSLVLGYPAYQSLAEGESMKIVTMFGMWAISYFVLYAVYVGWIQTGASVVRREWYSMKIGHTPLTRDEEILSQYGYFLRSTIGSIVRGKDIKQ